mmetsp:Transcript_67984/g.162283  ORF Transcript_67984/g.162283 Transcript_67984/m.162283 type:complete len:320 (+) Transcript_67984:2227-3186(+)
MFHRHFIEKAALVGKEQPEITHCLGRQLPDDTIGVGGHRGHAVQAAAAHFQGAPPGLPSFGAGVLRETTHKGVLAINVRFPREDEHARVPDVALLADLLLRLEKLYLHQVQQGVLEVLVQVDEELHVDFAAVAHEPSPQEVRGCLVHGVLQHGTVRPVPVQHQLQDIRVDEEESLAGLLAHAHGERALRGDPQRHLLASYAGQPLHIRSRQVVVDRFKDVGLPGVHQQQPVQHRRRFALGEQHTRPGPHQAAFEHLPGIFGLQLGVACGLHQEGLEVQAHLLPELRRGAPEDGVPLDDGLDGVLLHNLLLLLLFVFVHL